MHASSQLGPIPEYPPGFRTRRNINWIVIGLMYASYYMCRYNFKFAAPGIEKDFGFDHSDITDMLSVWSIAYGTGQLVNGLLTDRIGGKTAMLIGAIGTIVVNLVFGFSVFISSFSTMALVWLINGWFQSFGAPSMVKINAAWFNPHERGTFAGIFGFMIQLGQVAINWLGPVILAGMTIFTWTIAKGDWYWLFRIPPFVVAIVAVLFAFIPKESPEAAGYPGVVKDHSDTEDGNTRATIAEAFVTIFKHPLVWLYAIAYGCTGAVRQSSEQLSVLYFKDMLKLDLNNKPAAVSITLMAMPMAAVVGSMLAGYISDKHFKGQRSPVAMVLYFMEALVIGCAAAVINSGAVGPTTGGIFLGCIFLILISMTANSTHAIVGAAAPMDIGGKRMAGFASGVIDSFQYYGAAIALPITGRLIDTYGWGTWYPSMAAFGIIGGIAMWMVKRKQKTLSQPVT